MSTKSRRAHLSVMMFLQFFIWGAWYVTIGNFMTANSMASYVHWPYTVNPIAAIVSPFFLGLIADRYFATEKVLGVLHLIGGVVMLIVPQTSGNVVVFILLLALYNLCYMPTLGLVNTLAFHNIDDQEKQFPLIRVFGTIGWIVAGLFIGLVLSRFTEGIPDRTALPLYATGVASLVMGVYSFFLPHTPPPAKGQKVSLRSILGVDAFKALQSKPFWVFLIGSFLISIPLAAYYAYAPVFVSSAIYDTGVQNFFTGLLPNPSSLMSIGQMSEVLFMLVMPLFFIRLGVKWMLVVGMGAWVLRYALFAMAAPTGIFWMIAIGILLHGVCYDFFFVTGQIYVDKKSTPAIRGQAQGMLVLVIYGLGMFIGAQIAGWLNNSYRVGDEVLTAASWQSFWWVPAIFAGVVMILFAVFFNDKVETNET